VATTRRLFPLAQSIPAQNKSLSFYNTHTGESVRAVYCVDGKPCQEALRKVDYIMRDHRTGDIKTIDYRLLDLLHSISTRTETQKPFHIISGYRSPKTNALLHARSRGVARSSLHTKGKAVDIRLPEFQLSQLRKTAMNFKQGGVGYYPRSDFIHVDIGRVRYW